MEGLIVQAARLASAARLKGSSSVSEYTRNAQAIAKSWRKAVHDLDPDRFLIEALVAPEFDQKIDVLDQETKCAYEFKVSGKNAQSEFYKDIVKVIIWNEKRARKIKRLVFITEESFAKPALDAPMPQAFIGYLRDRGLEVTVAYIRPEEMVSP
jgi:hypothetical protein